MNKDFTITKRVEVLGKTMDVEVHAYLRYPDRYNKTKSILYVSVPDPDELTEHRHMERPPYTRKGDDLEIDEKWRKYNKLELSNQKEVIDALTPEIEQAISGLDRLGCQVRMGDLDMKWERKAGCSCGCSPGWRFLKSGRKVAFDSYFDLSVQITAMTDEKKVEMEAQKIKNEQKRLEDKIQEKTKEIQERQEEIAKLQEQLNAMRA